MSQQRIVLVTGATDGIGRQTALELLRRGARVLVHGRTLAKAKAVRDVLARESGSSDLLPVAADLSSMAAVRALAAEVMARVDRLDVLLSNAGVFMHERKLTEDGFETTFAVNHLAPFLLTHLLLPHVQKSDGGRIVAVSSIAHARGQIDFTDLTSERYFHGYTAYATSKLANVLFTYEIGRRLGGTNVTANALHPGVISTKLLRSGFGMGGGTVVQGAATSVRLAIDPALAGVTCKYFSDEHEEASSQTSHDRALQRRLYEVSAKLVGIAGLPDVT
ncbi:SDR family oxidoreductase [Polyangium jinanense]|uniref:SDR family oxidoreductase n=1 Tax=Polyangium jinanense TaxID=2829994 RepID=A0A9X4AR11_9BACT|nr:SDR family oxidoreductase [Polyangium jinanense]MDC3953255.1 SDR family oxidoreductase [Polyangium jinanense]MDC3979625.1 SDR family oxidoreductase [Polyangium jinanense]